MFKRRQPTPQPIAIGSLLDGRYRLQEQLGHATIELTVSTYGRWLKKKAPGALDRLDTMQQESEVAILCGSKVVADGSQIQELETARKPQGHELFSESLVPPIRIERTTRGLGNRCSIQLSYGGDMGC